ncbi:EamA family transporter RarD [Crossiella cryophila]|uniref:Chloramphenicol-sensitive protein RarD n=1 Tax=Crossiella cryophila TaxID=43355 RepID=A0A7W7C4I8_9PSEU|nr:EamA family transporter RarD [Crossiella cryophila]MBB4674412.1 chloramphenicol-sensitive protein RarD [Crossiella cryophila]
MPSSPSSSAGAAGLACGAGAYVLWGFFPAFWPLLAPAGPLEILAHRLVWTLAVMALVTLVLRRGKILWRLSPGGWLMAGAGAVLIAINWGVYIYGVTSGQVVETSLGYFINPLVSVLFGVLVFNERLRGAQWAAVAVGGAAVCVLTFEHGDVPVLALVLAASFGTYGLIKKTSKLAAVDSLTAESLVLGLPAIGFLVWLGAQGTFTTGLTGHDLLLMASGPITALPLLMFSIAARRVSMTTLGILQYLAPILQFAWGVLVLHEPMSPARWAGFALVWVAVMVFTVDGVLAARRVLRSRAEPAPQVTVGS